MCSAPDGPSTTSSLSKPETNSISWMCSFRTDIRAVRRARSSPFLMPHDWPSLMVHPCCSHFHFEHPRRHWSVSRRTPGVFGCSLCSRSSSASRCSSSSSGVTIPPSHDLGSRGIDSLRLLHHPCGVQGPLPSRPQSPFASGAVPYSSARPSPRRPDGCMPLRDCKRMFLSAPSDRLDVFGPWPFRSTSFGE
jgi:hypothetical protein